VENGNVYVPLRLLVITHSFLSFVVNFVDQGTNILYFNSEIVAVLQGNFRVLEPAHPRACSGHDDCALFESRTLRKKGDGLRYSMYHIPDNVQLHWHK
jgi:hypothetical protein